MSLLEFSRPINLGRFERKALEQSITATAEECEAIAVRLKIPAVGSLSAKLVLAPPRDGVIEVTGSVTSTVSQICVVSGDPFHTPISAEVRARFTSDPRLVEEFDPEAVDAFDEWDDIELVENNAIDLGELAVQYLSLSLDPYPRKPDAVWGEENGQNAVLSPFALLKGLKTDSADE